MHPEIARIQSMLGGEGYVADREIATAVYLSMSLRKPLLIEGARRFVHARGLSWGQVEFQMLYGIRRDLQSDLARRGYPVRTYIPYGDEWYPYLTRRLAERPANMWFFASQLVRGGGAWRTR